MASVHDLANDQALSIVKRYHLIDDSFKSKAKISLKLLKSAIESFPSVAFKKFKSAFISSSSFSPECTSSLLKSDGIFQSPSKIFLVGSHLLNCQLNSDPTADLVLELDEHFFQEGDLQDARYLIKRFLYLCYIADQMLKFNSSFSVSFTDLSSMRPLLCIVTDDAIKVTIHISAKEGIFSLETLNSQSKFLSERYFASHLSVPNVESVLYNCSIHRDFHFKDHLTFLHSVGKEVVNFNSACVLLKAWLLPRNNNLPVKFNFFLIMLSALLYQNGFYPRDASVFAIFTQVLKFLANNPDNWSFSSESSIDDFSERPIFFDSTGKLNLFYCIDAGVARYLSQEAKHSLGLFKVYSIYPEKAFQLMFPSDNFLSPSLEFDLCITIENFNFFDDSLFRSKRFLAMLGSSGDRRECILCWIPWMINKALPDRTSCIICIPSGENQISIKIRFSSESVATNSLLKGPSIDEKSGAAFFRSLWSSLSELKRYPNVTIHETVSCSPDCQNPLFFFVSFLLNRHALIPYENIQLIANPIKFPSFQQPLVCREVKNAFIQLYQLLKNNSEIATILTNLYPIDSTFRSTNLSFNKMQKTPILLAIQFEKCRNLSLSDDDLNTSWKCVNLFKLYQHFKSLNFDAFMSTDPFLDVSYMGFLFRIVPVSSDNEWEDFHAYKAVSTVSTHFTSNQLFSRCVFYIKKWLDCQLLLNHFKDLFNLIVECVVCKFFLENYATIDTWSFDRVMYNLFHSLSRFLIHEIYFDSESFAVNSDFHLDSYAKTLSLHLTKLSSFSNQYLPAVIIRRRIAHLIQTFPLDKDFFTPKLGDFDLIFERKNIAFSKNDCNVDLYDEAVRIVENEFPNCLFFTSCRYMAIIAKNSQDRNILTNRLSVFFDALRK